MEIRKMLREKSVGVVSQAQTKMACASRCVCKSGSDCESECAGCHKNCQGLSCRGVICRGESGQGTTEYAILVGVLVVIAILAITVFRGKIQELWNSISDGINSL